jgi:DNA transformation protein and related proteins
MGQKGAKLTAEASQACDKLVQALADLGNVSSKKMFGGYGVFESGTMFALIDSEGKVHFKANQINRKRFEDEGASQHGRMPYFELPQRILKDTKSLHEWALASIEISKG